MVLDDLTLWLETDGVATRATNLFYGYMPDSPDLCITLYEYGGYANEPHMGKTTINLEWPTIHCEARGARNDYTTPRALIQQVVTSFAKIGDTVIGSTKYGAVCAIQPVFPLLDDANQRHLFAVNFQIMKGYSA